MSCLIFPDIDPPVMKQASAERVLLIAEDYVFVKCRTRTAKTLA
jgi:hypothetical protein